MDNMIRTTILLPEELHEELKILAVKRKTTVSDLLREGVENTLPVKKKETTSLRQLDGKYTLKGKKSEFERSKFYDQYFREKVSA